MFVLFMRYMKRATLKVPGPLGSQGHVKPKLFFFLCFAFSLSFDCSAACTGFLTKYSEVDINNQCSSSSCLYLKCHDYDKSCLPVHPPPVASIQGPPVLPPAGETNQQFEIVIFLLDKVQLAGRNFPLSMYLSQPIYIHFCVPNIHLF